MKHPAVGEPAPDVELLRGDGDEVMLSTLFGEAPLVLVFLRHFG